MGLYLRAFEYEDLNFINKLRNNDVLFELTCGNKYFISSERDKKWIEDKVFNNYYQLYLMICEGEEENRIGYICANDIDYINRKAELGGLVIDEEYRNKGYGTKSLRMMLKHLFWELNMNMIYTYCRVDHTISVKTSKKLGFQNKVLLISFGISL